MPIYLKIKVIAGAKKEKVRKLGSDRYTMDVREPAENNLANGRILEIVREIHPREPVRIVRGHHSPNKTIQVGKSD